MRIALAALLVALAPSFAVAQSAEEIPPPPPFVEPALAPEASLDGPDERVAPTAAEPHLPRGYRRAHADAPAAMRTVAHVLSVGDDDLTLHSRARGSREPFAALCTAPCTLRLDVGSYELAVSPSGGGPRMADDQPVTLDVGRAAIQMSYDHRSGLRVLGWTFFSLGATSFGLSVGFAALFGGIGAAVSLISGIPIAVALWIPFFVFAFLEDSARVQVTALDE